MVKTGTIDAMGIYYKDLNDIIHDHIKKGIKKIVLKNVFGQRYIGDGLHGDNIEIIISGVPGNDLAAFMDGATVVVNGNAQDGVGNTMNSGKVIIYGDAGDIVGHSMRGGEIYVRGDVGYRVGIHMKEYKDLFPVIVVGGIAKDFLGEYMAGGLLILLGLNRKKREPIAGDWVGTGMHGGRMYIRGGVKEYQVGKEVGITELDENDKVLLTKYVKEFCKHFKLDPTPLLRDRYVKLYAKSHRPYGRLYAY